MAAIQLRTCRQKLPQHGAENTCTSIEDWPLEYRRSVLKDATKHKREEFSIPCVGRIGHGGSPVRTDGAALRADLDTRRQASYGPSSVFAMSRFLISLMKRSLSISGTRCIAPAKTKSTRSTRNPLYD